jgi:Flp pilus assembly protein TadD
MRSKRALTSTALVVLAVVAYASMFRNGPVIDDVPLTLQNPYVQKASGLVSLFSHDMWTASGQHEPSSFYRPVWMASYLANRLLLGNSVASYHAGNLFFHATACLALYSLLLPATPRRRDFLLAALGAAWFTTSALNSEAVAWISGRCDSLGAAFGAGALLARRLTKSWRPWVTWLLASAAIFSKESFIVVPAMIVLYDGLVLRRQLRDEKASYALVAASVAAYFGLRSLVGVPAASVVAGTGPLVLLRSFLFLVADYPIRLLFPYRLCFMCPYRQPSLAASLVVLLAAGGVSWWLWRAQRRRPDELGPRAALFGWLWFLVSVAPLSLPGPNLHIVGDRYAYFPAMGLCVLAVALAAELADRTPSSWTARAGTTALVLATLGVAAQGARTVVRLRDWKDETTLFRAALAADPNDFFALYYLGHLAAERGELSEGERLLQQSLALEPDQYRAHNALCFVYLNRNELELAEAECKASLRMRGTDPRTWVNLASAYVRLARWDAGLDASTRATELKPLYAEAHYLRAVCLANLGRLPEAVAEDRETLVLDPAHAGAASLAEQFRTRGL